MNKTLSATKFKEQCLAALDEVDGEGIVITKHGKPVARLIPYRQSSAALIGSVRGTLAKDDNLFSSGMRWHAES